MVDKIELQTAAEQCAELIEQGWIQKRYHSADNTAHCALGAIHAVTGITQSLSWELQERLAKVAHPGYGHVPMTAGTLIKIWNDDEDRKQAEVADAFRMVAKDISNGEL